MTMTARAAGIKRKTKPSASSLAKRVKTKHVLTDDLPWKKVSKPREADLGTGMDGFLDLEEVQDVDVVFEETEAGRVVKFKVRGEDDEGEDVLDAHVSEGEEVAGQSSAVTTENIDLDALPEPIKFDTKSLLPEWHSFKLHPQLARALYAKKLTTPTPIQAQTLPLALKNKDVVGVAETGSGKTLAYGLPILHYLLTEAYSRPIPSNKTRRPVRALVLAPTRELALQVSSHLNACLSSMDVDAVENKTGDDEVSKKGKNKGKAKAKAKAAETPALENKPKHPPLVSVAAVVGGMSAQKQRRIISRGVDVLVATPGRLWDILQEDDELATQIEFLRFLVLDEADRMIETGHFAELDNILRLTLRKSDDDVIGPENKMDEEEDTKDGVRGGDLQTFVFSATLSKDLQQNLKRRARPKPRRKADKPASTLDDLLLRLDFRDPSPAVVDIAPASRVPAALTESRVDCLAADKDAYLYYFLLRYPGRTLVFLSAIDGIRRLLPLLALLGVPAFPLHSQLEQRQRLKNLDRFASTRNAVLLATDVAARGLDITGVDHVVHYQAPRTADAYVHRNGRTARAMRRGFALLMCAPDERRVVRALMRGLGREEEELAEMPVELYMLDKLKARVQLAREIDRLQHKAKKERHERSWLKEAAEAMEIELDSDLASDSDEDKAPSKQKQKAAGAKAAALKAQLKAMLTQPLVARGVSTRYITSGVRSIADDLLAGEYHETMVGMKKVEAGSDLVPAKARKAKKRATKAEEEEFEEWGGISVGAGGSDDT
ncbi:DEAD-domain-containing protein [Dichomitus squalens]|uniref:RNA helicase n=1 Tax=Dichomitus squalens TaxID=114155 RepID=A0A4Q9NC02_9APHY|nr:DEAD-domain-containing protein [Dichomitus squalens]TBU60422.1 DEAD-domain-containing protein [Dichomitus squalens]